MILGHGLFANRIKTLRPSLAEAITSINTITMKPKPPTIDSPVKSSLVAKTAFKSTSTDAKLRQANIKDFFRNRNDATMSMETTTTTLATTTSATSASMATPPESPVIKPLSPETPDPDNGDCVIDMEEDDDAVNNGVDRVSLVANAAEDGSGLQEETPTVIDDDNGDRDTAGPVRSTAHLNISSEEMNESDVFASGPGSRQSPGVDIDIDPESRYAF